MPINPQYYLTLGNREDDTLIFEKKKKKKKNKKPKKKDPTVQGDSSHTASK